MRSFICPMLCFPAILCVFLPYFMDGGGFRCFYCFGVFTTRAQYRASLLMIIFTVSMVYVFWKDAIWINNEFFILIADRLRRFSRTSLMITVAKKDKAEGSWMKSDRQRCSKINGILKGTNKRQSGFDSNRGLGLEKVQQLLSWSRYMKYLWD